LREFCARNRVPHSWIDVDEQGDAEQLLQQLGIRPDETPVVIFRNDQVLRNPTNRDLGRLLGMSAPEPVGVCDLLVVGAGPAGLAAAVYGASEGLQTIVVDSVAAGGQAATSSRIENYLGFPAGISGAELAERAAAQAKKFGATITVPAEAVGLDFGRDGQVVTLSDGGQLTARVMVIATGARYRRLDVPRLAEFEGSSIFYAATYMEARFCDRRPVVVVGGGNSAGQAVLYLSRYAADVTLLVRHDDLNQDMSRYLVDQIENTPAIDVRRNSQLRELEGRDGELESIIAVNHRTGKQQRIPARVMFVFIGALPCTAWLRGAIALDDNGYVQTGPATTAPATGDRHPFVREVPGMLETNQPGVLAVGDVRSGSIKRVASAVGEGATAVRLIHDHLAKIGWMGARSNHPT
jgi:thioredoxin reductase (NADPH)